MVLVLSEKLHDAVKDIVQLQKSGVKRDADSPRLRTNRRC